MTPFTFSFDKAKADSICTHDALRLLAALRSESENSWLQTFRDRLQELHRPEYKVSNVGKPYTLRSYYVIGVPNQASKSRRLVGARELKAVAAVLELLAPLKIKDEQRAGEQAAELVHVHTDHTMLHALFRAEQPSLFWGRS